MPIQIYSHSLILPIHSYLFACAFLLFNDCKHCINKITSTISLPSFCSSFSHACIACISLRFNYCKHGCTNYLPSPRRPIFPLSYLACFLGWLVGWLDSCLAMLLNVSVRLSNPFPTMIRDVDPNSHSEYKKLQRIHMISQY